MANEIYPVSWWGVGVTANTISWGKVYEDYREFKGILDDFPNSTIAYSLRRLSSSYEGSAINVIRDNGDSLDIGFLSNGNLDTSALMSFVGGGDGLVSIWYDQSGNNNNITQSTTSLQPKIVDNGVLNLTNSKPTIKFNSNILSTNITNIENSESAFIIANGWTDGAVLSINKSATSDKFLFFKASSTDERFRYNGNSPLLESYSDKIQNSYVAIANSTDVKYYKNKDLKGTDTRPFITTDDEAFNLGARYEGNLNFDGDIQEVIYYKSDLTNDLNEFVENQETFYNNDLDFENKIILTPDSSGGDVGEGFTITGIFIDELETSQRTDGKVVVWCANDGRNIEPPFWNGQANAASIVKLLVDINASDFSYATKLDELIVSNDVNFGTGKTMQGICLNNNNDIAFVSGDTIYIYDKDGVFVDSQTLISNVNGIAFDTNNNYYLVYNINGDLTRFDTSFNEIDSFTIDASSDQLFYDNTSNRLYASRGVNGSEGNYKVYDSNFTEIDRENKVEFTELYSAEGISIYNQYLFFATDGYFHRATPYDFNGIGIYRIK